MGKIIDLTGQRFGRLTVVERAKNRNRSKDAYWLCCCDCGQETVVCGKSLRVELTKSCGCLNREKNKSHGGSESRLYRIWVGMKARCNNSKCHSFPRYGGRGIAVCTEWERDFSAFQEWAKANGYRDELTLDRIDNDKGYCPENCRWVPMYIQVNNRSNNCFLTLDGRTQTVAQWSRELGIPETTVRERKKRGWSDERTLLTPSASMVSATKTKGGAAHEDIETR